MDDGKNSLSGMSSLLSLFVPGLELMPFQPGATL